MAQEKSDSPAQKPELILSNPPHLHAPQSVTGIMWLVVAALIPAAGYSIHLYGFKALVLMISAVLTAIIAEAAFQLLMKKKVSVTDGSAVITGLLLVMNVPPDAPVWMVCIGSAFAIIIAKQLFGGVGFNIFNPALAGRAFLLASWPVYMTTKWHQFSPTNVLSQGITNFQNMPAAVFDAVTSATPLAALKGASKIIVDMNVPADAFYNFLLSNEMLKSLFIGNIGGCVGETSALLLLAGALLLFYKRIITWHVPLTYMGTVAAFTFTYYTFAHIPGTDAVPHFTYRMVLFHLLSGGLVLGAFFMATDMVTSPVTQRGMIVFGIGCGLLTCVIRLWGGYPEGVSYSILLMNATVPLIDRFFKPRVFGAVKDDTSES
ncbi:MAG: RnfABCDGE type electron transport complex subunit D [Spirochaetes bacterium]|nr:RnfABCDGE type electron transport complex subunit D [Spirochaetota bacterium]